MYEVTCDTLKWLARTRSARPMLTRPGRRGRTLPSSCARWSECRQLRICAEATVSGMETLLAHLAIISNACHHAASVCFTKARLGAWSASVTARHCARHVHGKHQAWLWSSPGHAEEAPASCAVQRRPTPPGWASGAAHHAEPARGSAGPGAPRIQALHDQRAFSWAAEDSILSNCKHT